MGQVIRMAPCEKCGSRDNLAIYADGGTHCFSLGCNVHTSGDGTKEVSTDKNDQKQGQQKNFIFGSYKELKSRGLTEDTCRRWGYQVAPLPHPETKEEYPAHIANFYNDKGELTGQKIRYGSGKDKTFKWIGKAETFYGRNLCQPGKILVITEGELDCLSVSQIQNHKYPVLSLPDGVSSASRVIKKELQWLEENFHTIVLMFDSDKVGQEAAKEVSSLFTPGKCCIAKLPEKDANEMLLKGRAEELINAIFRAKPYTPESIVPGSETWSLVSEKKKAYDAKYTYEFLNRMTLGLRLGEVVTICAGSGIGKSQFCREIAYSLVQQDFSIGYIALEESVRRTALGFMSIEANIPLHTSIDGISVEELKVIHEKSVDNGKVFFCDQSFLGASDYESLFKSIRFLAKGNDVKWIVLDHISMVVSAIGEGDERRLIDNLMTKVRSLAEELKIGILVVSHLKRPDGKGHEEGHEVSLAQLRGSAAIAQLSDIVLGLERNQQDPEDMHITTVRVLKNRFTGETGIAGCLEYNPTTGRLTQLDGERVFVNKYKEDKPKSIFKKDKGTKGGDNGRRDIY